MIQLKVYKTKGDSSTALFLDLYETEPIKLTLSIEDITQADATSVFSKTFRVPATRHNNEFFENAYEVDGIFFDVTLKNYAEILVDGAEFREGHIRLQKIFRNQDLDRIDYELLFLGETRDFSSTIAEKTLCQLTMTDFNWEGLPQNYTNAADFTGPFQYNDIVVSWNAFPENASLTAGYADGDIIMPLIDHGNTYDDGDPEQGTIALGATGQGIRSFTHQINSLALTRMKPMFRAKRVWDQIFEDAGYTYSSTFLNSDKFHQMYISAFGNNEQIGMEIDQVTGTNFESNNPTSGENDINAFMYNDNVITNIAGNYTVGSSNTNMGGNGSYFTCPGDSGIGLGDNFYIMSASAELAAYVEQSNGPNISVPAFLRLVVVNTPGGTIQRTLATGNNAGNGSTSTINFDSRNLPAADQLVAGEIIQVYLDTSSGFVDYSYADNTYWDCTAAPGDYYAPLDLDCEHKQIDYIKDILTMFRLVMQPDNKRPNNFIIEPWQEFIGSGTTYDWSHKLVEDMDSVLEPLFNTQSATIEYSFAQDEDFINKFHFDNNKHPYGWLQFNSTNELLKGTRKIDVKGIAPTPIDQILDTTGNHPEPTFILPSIVEVTGEQTSSNPARPEQLPIKPKTRFLFYNGKEPITVSQHQWYLNNDSGNGVLQTNYPLVSPYENWPVQQTSLNLNFSNDTRYYINPSPGTGYFDQGSTLFDEYWSRYISSLYNKFSRRLTAKFILNNVDLQDLTFDDVIFVNGKYYRPEKIIDAQVGAETVVTCQLITLGDQRPIWLEEPLTGFSVVASNTSCLGQEGEIQITTNGTPAFTWELDASGAQGNVNPSGSAPFTFTIPAPVGVDTLTVTDSLGRVAVVQVNVPASTASQVTSTNSVVQPTICSNTPVVETTIVNYESTVAQPVSTNGNYAIFNTKVVDLLESQVARPLPASGTGFNAFNLDYNFRLNTTTYPNLTTEWSGTITWTNLSFITTNWSQYELGYSGPDGLTPTVIPSQYISGWPTNLPPVGTSFTVTVTGLPVQYGAAGISPSPTMDFLVLKNSSTNSDWNGKWENTGSIIGKQLTVATTCNGEIDVTPAGGAGAPYTVIWNDGVTAEDRTGLCPGNYQYYVEDVNGCQSDIYDVTLTCQTTLYYYQLREHLNNCTQSSSATYIASSTSQLPINQTVTLNERAGCYYVQAISTATPLYTIDALNVSCAACNGGGTPVSYEVETCNTGANTYYASRTGAALVPGNVVELNNQSGCYIVIGDSTVAATSDVTSIYADCATCLSTPPVYYYGFLSCDGTFDGPIESPVQLSLGSFIDITPGPGCGSVYKETNGPAIYTWSGTLLYQDCDACNGVTPPPAQNCHLIQNSSLAIAQGTYTLNGLSYTWTVKPGTTSSICAVVGSVVTTSGTATITNQGNACTQPGDCLIGPPPPSVYTIEDCATSALFTMDDQGSQFQIGDVIQYYANTQGTGARYCGTVINYTGTTLNAYLANPFVSYFCGDTIHCAE